MSAIGKCPWPGCGSDATVIIGRYVRCDNQDCMAQGPLAANPEAAITAWNRLATPDPAEVRGRIRWTGYYAYIGRLPVGRVRAGMFEGTWWADPFTLTSKSSTHPTEALARAALVATVREAIGDNG